LASGWRTEVSDIEELFKDRQCSWSWWCSFSWNAVTTLFNFQSVDKHWKRKRSMRNNKKLVDILLRSSKATLKLFIECLETTQRHVVPLMSENTGNNNFVVRWCHINVRYNSVSNTVLTMLNLSQKTANVHYKFTSLSIGLWTIRRLALRPVMNNMTTRIFMSVSIAYMWHWHSKIMLLIQFFLEMTIPDILIKNCHMTACHLYLGLRRIDTLGALY
jgi:hypothetical protein